MSENLHEIETLARELFARAQRGEDIVSHRALRAEMLGTLGEIRALEFLGTKHVMQRDTPETEHSFRLTFENGRIDYRLGFFPDGTLNRFGLHPIPGEVNPLDKYKSDPVPLLIASLGLRPHPEGGFFTETYRHERSAGDRSLCTAIYFLLTAENPSRMHRVASDEIWHFYKGDPLEMLQLGVNGSQRIRIGTDIASGQRPQVLVPAGTWQGVRVAPGGSYALVGATVSPGFDFADFEMGDRAALVSTHPEATDLIKELTSSP